MLRLDIPGQELFDEETYEITELPARQLVMEHSLISISKWESKWKKVFLTNDSKTAEEIADYYKHMTLTKNVPDVVFKYLPMSTQKQILEYINDSNTATTIYGGEKNTKKEVYTAEVIYYQMIALNIPMGCQKWHINRLLTLINVVNLKTNPGKARPNSDVLSSNYDENIRRRKLYGTEG